MYRITNIKYVSTVFLAMVIALCFLQGNVFASKAYSSYTYDSYGNQVLIPDLYSPEKIITASEIGLNSFNAPEDMAIDENGNIYILDTGANRVVILDENYELEKIIEEFTINQLLSPIRQARGIFVKDGLIYIADTGNNRVICSDKDGAILFEIHRPDSEFFSETVEFIPTKLVLDRAGNLYIRSTGFYQGLIIIDFNKEFQGFFGSEMVTTTAQAVQDFFWKRFMTPEQREAMAQYVPPEIRNMTITENDFIYTVTNSRYVPLTNIKTQMDIIRRINPKGIDTLRSKMLPRAQRAMEDDARMLNFVGISADKNGFIALIDNSLGRIYQFDSEMNLITAFGGYGDYAGTFLFPVAIESYEGKIYVLDRSKNSITVFGLTQFGQKVHDAVLLHNIGKYEQAIEPWQEVLRFNTNYDLAYLGVGKALLNQREYEKAMYYFELGRDSYWYNEAYKEYRIQNIRNNIVRYLLVLAGLLIIRILYKNKIFHKLFTIVKRKYIEEK